MAIYGSEEKKQNNVPGEIADFLTYEEDGNTVRLNHSVAEAFELPEEIPEQPDLIREVNGIYRGSVAVPSANRGIDFLYMLFLTSAILVTLIICIQYLQIRSDIVELNRMVNSLEIQLSDSSSYNDALEAEIDSQSFDSEYVYNTAVGVLGMVFPNKNEICVYSDNMTSYYREYAAAD